MRDLLERAGISMHVLKIPYLSPSTSFSLSLLLCRSISRSFCFYNLYINYISLYIDHLTWLYLYFHFSLSLSLSLSLSINLSISISIFLRLFLSLSLSLSLSLPRSLSLPVYCYILYQYVPFFHVINYLTVLLSSFIKLPIPCALITFRRKFKL